MRKLHSLDIPGLTVEEVVNELNERREEFGIDAETDLVSVSVRKCESEHKIAIPDGTKPARVMVTVVYWGD